MGRPSLYDSKYCALLEKHMASGRSFTSFASKIGVGRRTLYDWCQYYPEFMDAHQAGYSAALLYFENLLLDGIKGKTSKNSKGISATLLIFTLKTRFHTEYGEAQSLPKILRNQPIDIANLKDPEEMERLAGPPEETRKALLDLKQEVERSLELFDRTMTPNPFEDL